MNTNRKMIFIVGNSRSGTTMMARILGANPNIFSFHELHYFERMTDMSEFNLQNIVDVNEAKKIIDKLIHIQRDGFFSSYKEGKYIDEVANVIGETCNSLTSAEIFSRFLLYETKLHKKNIPCEQSPKNVFFIKEIITAYPSAFIINMVRDPRDVLLSQKNKWKRRFLGGEGIPLFEAIRARINYHPITIAKLWVASIRAADKFMKDPRIFTLRFEDLLDTPERCISELCDFIDLEYNSEMIAVPQVGSSTGHDNPIKKGIDKEKIGKWRFGGLNATELFLCEKITHNEMQIHGYKGEAHIVNLILLLGYIISLPFQLILAVLFNIGRTKNLLESIKRRLLN